MLIQTLRSHYQASMLDSILKAVTTGKKGPKMSVWKRLYTVLLAETLCVLSQMGLHLLFSDIFVARTFAHGKFFAVKERLNAMGKSKFVLALQSDLMCSIIQQDLAFFDQLHTQGGLGDLRFLVEQCEVVTSQLFDFPMGLVEHSFRLWGSLFLLWNKSSRLALLLTAMLPLKMLIESLLASLQVTFPSAVYICFHHSVLMFL